MSYAPNHWERLSGSLYPARAILTRASSESLKNTLTLSIILENLAFRHDCDEVPCPIFQRLDVGDRLQQVGERTDQLLGQCHGLPVEAQALPGRGGGAVRHMCSLFRRLTMAVSSRQGFDNNGNFLRAAYLARPASP